MRAHILFPTALSPGSAQTSHGAPSRAGAGGGWQTRHLHRAEHPRQRTSRTVQPMLLLHHEPGFRRLWLARTFSCIGKEVTCLARPLIAAISLDATLAQMAPSRL